MSDVRHQIMIALIGSKKPMRAYHLSKKLKTSQSHIEYHLKQMVADGLVIEFNDEDGRFYDAQRLLKKKEVMDDFMAVMIGAIPNILPYLDTSQCDNQVDGVINNVVALMRCAEKNMERELGQCKELVNIS